MVGQVWLMGCSFQIPAPRSSSVITAIILIGTDAYREGGGFPSNPSLLEPS